MESYPPDQTILTDAIELLDLWSEEARAIEKGSRISWAHSAGVELRGAPIRGSVELGSDFISVSYDEVGGVPEYACDACGDSGCAHVLLLLCGYFGVKVRELKALYEARELDTKRLKEKESVGPKKSTFGLAVTLRERLGRELDVEEAAYAQEVDALFRRHSAGGMLAASALDPFLKKNPLPAWELVELWPRRPENTWEAWLYLAAFLRNRGLEWPPFLAAITTVEAIERLAGDWERQQALRQWEDGLGKLLTEMETSQDRRAVDARIQIGATHARLQWRRDARAEEWSYPSEVQYDELISYLDKGRLDCDAAVYAPRSFLSVQHHLRADFLQSGGNL